MSRETSSWLNRNVLIGFTDKRGKAWHWRAADQGDESNHYPGAIPVEDVQRRLFDWKAIELPLQVQIPSSPEEATGMDEEGNPVRTITLSDRKAIAASDTFDVLGVFKEGYQPHQYSEWLVRNIATILDDDIAISSAGLLKNRAVAWVEVSVPDSIKTPSGVEFRPNLIGATSFDGTLATTFKRTVTATVCDNSLSLALSEKGQDFKVKHSKYSNLRIADAREALAIVYETADDFTREVEKLTNETVTETQWQSVLNALVPIPEEKENKRGYTMAVKKQEKLDELYRYDSRANVWQGTKFGIFQTFNTFDQHVSQLNKETNRVERNALNVLNGKSSEADAKVLQVLATI